MTTAQDIITRAYKTAGIIGAGETPSATESADGLVYLNDLLEGLSNEHLMIYQDVQEDITLANAVSYTWGSGGTISTTRPLKLMDAHYTESGGSIDYPVRILTKNEYDDISLKTDTGDIVDYIYLYSDYPLATLYVYPKVSTGTLTITSWKPLTSISTLATAISLPPGYERMLRYNLAMEIVDEYGMEAPANLAVKARDSKSGIKRVNRKPRAMTVDLPVYPKYGSDIERGF